MEARNANYCCADNSAIMLEVNIDGQWLSYVARASDCEKTGRDLYARAIAGQFGPIAAYAPE